MSPEELSAFTMEALGEAFISARNGGVSRAAFEGKVLAVLFLSHLICSDLISSDLI